MQYHYTAVAGILIIGGCGSAGNKRSRAIRLHLYREVLFLRLPLPVALVTLLSDKTFIFKCSRCKDTIEEKIVKCNIEKMQLDYEFGGQNLGCC